jgi:hypothetical protein
MPAMPSAFACSSRILLLTLALGLGGACAHGKGKQDEPASLLAITTSVDDQDADVWVDGQYVGQVGAVSGKVLLAPGVHRVEVRKAGRFPVQKTVKVERKPDASIQIEAELLVDPR